MAGVLQKPWMHNKMLPLYETYPFGVPPVYRVYCAGMSEAAFTEFCCRVVESLRVPMLPEDNFLTQIQEHTYDCWLS